MFYPGASKRTLAIAALIEGFFGCLWFGWGQEGPPDWAVPVLITGQILTVLLLLGGVLAMLRAPRDSSPLRDRAAARRYGITVGAEFGVCGVGAAILGVTGHAEFIAALICFVVGVHFTPLNRVFPGIGMLALSGAVTAVAIAALITGLLSPVLPSTVTGLGAGICLLGHGASLLTGALSRKTA